MSRLKSDLGWSMGAGLMVTDQDDDPTVRRRLAPYKFLYRQVGRDSWPLEVTKHDDADQEPRE